MLSDQVLLTLIVLLVGVNGLMIGVAALALIEIRSIVKDVSKGPGTTEKKDDS